MRAMIPPATCYETIEIRKVIQERKRTVKKYDFENQRISTIEVMAVDPIEVDLNSTNK